jgi:acyl carrier protein phosphodiesterase
MNYLAHAYLSFNNPEILTGNMISDFIKGNKKLGFASGIQKGIMLHRAIDEFTDNHPATKLAKEFFRKDYRLYSGAFVDIVYDHFLAKDKNEFANDDALKLFASNTYKLLRNYSAVFPQRFDQYFGYMETQDWLYNYQHTRFIERSFEGLTKRALYMSDPIMATNIFAEHYHSLEDCYNNFFSDLKMFAFHHFVEILKN